ncbi:MAG: hypothetical protein ACE5DX_03515 [Candidatus Dojkabacteria bacterium]
MKAAIIGAKLGHKWDDEISRIKTALEKKSIKTDFSYFDTSTDEDAQDLEAAYKRNQKLIKNTDFLIAEATEYSSGIGYLIATALNEKKPVLAMHNKAKGAHPSNIIKSSSNSKLLTFAEYESNDIDRIIIDFANRVKGMLDTKFILIISPEIERYLEWSSDYRRMHKAQIVRQAVEEQIAKDKEYKDYLKSEVA